MMYTMYKNGNRFVFCCENCNRHFEADLPDDIAGKIRTKDDLRTSYFKDEPDHPLYNIRYLIKYGVCWKCRKDPDGMKKEAKEREDDRRRSHQLRFNKWIDSLD